MWRLRILCPQPRSLLHTESVLLVDNHKTKIREFDPILNQGVRSDQHIYLARLQSGQNLFAFLGLCRTCQYRHSHRYSLAHLRYGGIVLSSQNLGRHHQARLVAVVACEQHRKQRHNGLSATHIALQKSIHLDTRHHILADIAHRLLLTFGQFEWEFGVVEGVEFLAHFWEEETIPAPRAFRATSLDVELDAEQLVKFETVLRLA